MKLRRSILAPVAVLATAVLTGGWFLQQGVDGALPRTAVSGMPTVTKSRAVPQINVHFDVDQVSA